MLVTLRLIMGIINKTSNYLVKRFRLFPGVISAVLMMLIVLVLIIAIGNEYPPPYGNKKPVVFQNQEGVEKSVSTVKKVSDGNIDDQKPLSKEMIEPCKPAYNPLVGQIKLDFGWQQQPVLHDWRYHDGVDIQLAASCPVKAVYSGAVTKIYTDKAYGLTVAVKCGDTTVYYGSLADSSINVGQAVTAGQVIGIAGTSVLEPYSHLHLAVKKGDKIINPKVAFSDPK